MLVGRQADSVKQCNVLASLHVLESSPLPRGAAAAGKGLFWHSVPSLTQAAGAGVHAGEHLGREAVVLRGCQDTG